jgi:MFS family permease
MEATNAKRDAVAPPSLNAGDGDPPIDRPLLDRSLVAVRREAALTAAMTGATDPFMAPYLLAVGGSAFQAGLLSSVRNLTLALIQLLSGPAIESVGRKRLVVWTAALQGVVWLPLAAVGALRPAGAPIALNALYTIGTGAAVLGQPAWGSLVSVYLPPHERGRFFGARARIAGVWGAIAGLVAGLVLHVTRARPVVGFAVLCVVAAAARGGACAELTRLHEAPWNEDPHLRSSFLRFLRHVRHNNFTRFSVCLAALNCAAYMSAPFFAVYLLEELRYDYLAYTAVTVAGSVTGMVAAPWWGAVGDVYGNQRVLRWTTFGVGVLPVLWLAFPDPLAMMVVNALGAFLWAGLNLATANFTYDSVGAQQRHTSIAYFNVLNGIGVSFGAFAGGWALAALPQIDGSQFAAVFIVSAALRLVAAAVFHRTVREVRHVRQLGLREAVFDLLGQRLVQVLGYFSVDPERERPRHPRRGARRKRT